MKTNRMYRYRVYPTQEQEALFRRWQGILRFLWNICHEQRLMGLARTQKVYLSNAEQNKEMTLLQETPGFEWIQDLQCQARQKVTQDLDDAWKRCFKKLGGRPRFKRKGDTMRIYVPTGTVCYTITPVGNGRKSTLHTLTFEGPRYRALGPLVMVLDRALPEGRLTSWSITKEVTEWYATAVIETEHEAPAPNTKPPVGIDRGVRLILADSDGRVVPRPEFLDASKALLERAQRQLSRKKKGSANFRKAAIRVAKIQQRVARSRSVMTDTESRYYADRYGTVVLEDLKIGNMTRSAKGTEENPGTQVRQKAGLNRSILGSAWGAFEAKLKYKLTDQGGQVVKVSAAYTSQTCPQCGNVDEENRPDQATFRCTVCAYERNADLNAAVNIRDRGLAVIAAGKPAAKVKKSVKMSRLQRKPKPEPSVKPTEAACGGSPDGAQ